MKEDTPPYSLQSSRLQHTMSENNKAGRGRASPNLRFLEASFQDSPHNTSRPVTACGKFFRVHPALSCLLHQATTIPSEHGNLNKRFVIHSQNTSITNTEKLHVHSSPAVSKGLNCYPSLQTNKIMRSQWMAALLAKKKGGGAGVGG